MKTHKICDILIEDKIAYIENEKNGGFGKAHK